MPFERWRSSEALSDVKAMETQAGEHFGVVCIAFYSWNMVTTSHSLHPILPTPPELMGKDEGWGREREGVHLQCAADPDTSLTIPTTWPTL